MYLIVDNKVMSVVEVLDMLDYEISHRLQDNLVWGGSNKVTIKYAKILELVDKGYYTDALDLVLKELGHDVKRGKYFVDPWGDDVYLTVGQALDSLYNMLTHEISQGDYEFTTGQVGDLLLVCEFRDNNPVLFNQDILDLLEYWGYVEEDTQC